MRPRDIQQIGEELAIKWEDGSESFVALEKLRRHCPCAGCRGEADVLGNVYKSPAKPLGPAAFQLRRVPTVGVGFELVKVQRPDGGADHGVRRIGKQREGHLFLAGDDGYASVRKTWRRGAGNVVDDVRVWEERRGQDEIGSQSEELRGA